MSVLAAGAGRVYISDVSAAKLAIAANQGPGNIIPVNVSTENLAERIYEETMGWGCDYFFEATGNTRAAGQIFDCIAPGGTVVLIGHPGEPVSLDVVPGQVKEVTVKTIFRYAHVFPAVLNLMGKGALDVKPLISKSFKFKDSIEAYDHAVTQTADPNSNCVKNMIIMD